MTDLLTLCKGKKKTAYEEITVDGDLLYAKERAAARRAVDARFPELVALDGAERLNHPDFHDHDGAYWVEAMVTPFLRAAWAGDGKAPTCQEIRGSFMQTEVMANLKAAITANPLYLSMFPSIELDEPDDDVEDDTDPNLAAG